MEFKILQNTGNDKKDWTALVEGLDPALRDIHFIPEYGRIYKKTYDYEPLLAFYGDEKKYIIQPFVKRKLNDLPFLKEQSVVEEFYDIANPYGYGGPVCSQRGDGNLHQFFNDFIENFYIYCKDQKIASEFTSLHPLLHNHTLFSESTMIKTQFQKQIVYMDLEGNETDIFRNMNRGHRSAMKKAKSLGITIEKVEPTEENFEKFKRIYYPTMKRQGAAERWFFPEDYFLNCHHCLGSDRISLFFAFFEEEIASAYLLMHDYNTVYYHFGASDERFFDCRPNNLLMFEIALWAQREGYRIFHLGGGVTSSLDDPLFQYKKGFSDKRADIYVYFRVHNSGVYEYLTELKIKHEMSRFGRKMENNYFPIYRREKIS